MVIVCMVPSFAAEDASVIDEAETAILEAVATGADTIANGAIDIALKYAPQILPESVKVKDKSEYQKDTLLTGRKSVVRKTNSKSAWRLGYAQASILPKDFGTATYYRGGYDVNVEISKCMDDLKVRVFALDDSSGRGIVVFAVVDCIGLANEDIQEIRQALASWAAKNNVVGVNVSATHTHTSIDSQGIYTDIYRKALHNIAASFAKSDDLEYPISKTYWKTIKKQTVKSVKKAVSNMKTGTLSYNKKSLPDYHFDRTPTNCMIDDLYRLTFQPSDGSKGTIIASFGAHPESYGDPEEGEEDEIAASSDYIYYMEEIVNQAGYNFAFVQGSLGAVSASAKNEELFGTYNTHKDRSQHYGNALGKQLMSMKAGKKVTPYLNFKTEQFLLPVEAGAYIAFLKVSLANNAFYKDGDDYYTSSEVGYLELGSQVKAILSPGETFGELIKGGTEGMKNQPLKAVYDQLGTKDVMIWDLQNDAVGYLIPVSEYGYVRVYVGEDGKSLDGCGRWGVTSPGPNGSVDVYRAAYKLVSSMH